MRLLFLLMIVACLTALAQDQARAQPAVASGSISWSALTDKQQDALSPLAELWPSLRSEHQRKWIALVHNFNRMTPQEQSTLQGRMTRWARLTAAERNKARQNYDQARRLSADEKRAKWEEYQALPAQERERLAKKRPKSPVGAAPALHPQPASRLVRLPAPDDASPAAPVDAEVEHDTPQPPDPALQPEPAASQPEPAALPDPAARQPD